MLDLYILGIESGVVGLLYFYILGAIIRDRYFHGINNEKEENQNEIKKQHI